MAHDSELKSPFDSYKDFNGCYRGSVRCIAGRGKQDAACNSTKPSNPALVMQSFVATIPLLSMILHAALGNPYEDLLHNLSHD